MPTMAVDAWFIPLANENVVVMRWPEQRAEAERLFSLGVPVLWLVEPRSSPPSSSTCLEDWLRLPADDQDVRARLEALSMRAAHHPAVPELDGFGQLSFAGRRVFLSLIDERVARVLVESFDRVVAEDRLLYDVWPDGGKTNKVRVHISRLRKRLLPLDLEITAVRHHGYRLHRANGAASHQIPVS